MTDRSTIIKQRVIIVLLVVVIIAGLMATANMAANYAETNEGLIEINDSLRDRVVEQNAQIESLQNKISIQEESE